MTVEIGYTGRFGNNLFQYIAGRLFAMENDLFYKEPPAPWPDWLFDIRHSGKGRMIDGPVVVLDESSDLFGKKWEPALYRMSGFFQRAHWYHDRRTKILRFISPSIYPPFSQDDIVMHVRLQDYKGWKIAIHPEWYKRILRKEKFSRLHIVTDEIDNQYLAHFKEWTPIVRCGNPWDDWTYLMGFNRIITANSSYSWWAAFFSSAEKVYLHKRWLKATPSAQLNYFPNGVTLDGPFIDELDW